MVSNHWQGGSYKLYYQLRTCKNRPLRFWWKMDCLHFLQWRKMAFILAELPKYTVGWPLGDLQGCCVMLHCTCYSTSGSLQIICSVFVQIFADSRFEYYLFFFFVVAISRNAHRNIHNSRSAAYNALSLMPEPEEIPSPTVSTPLHSGVASSAPSTIPSSVLSPTSPAFLAASKCFRASKLQAARIPVLPRAWPFPEAFLLRQLIEVNLLPKRRLLPLLALALPPLHRPQRLLLLRVGQIILFCRKNLSSASKISPHGWRPSPFTALSLCRISLIAGKIFCSISSWYYARFASFPVRFGCPTTKRLERMPQLLT